MHKKYQQLTAAYCEESYQLSAQIPGKGNISFNQYFNIYLKYTEAEFILHKYM